MTQRSPATDRTTFRVTATEYDALGRQTKRIDSCTTTGTTVPAEYTSCSGAGTANAETNIVTTWTYDANGNQLSETAPDPSVTTTTGTATVITRFAYDRAGRLCRVLENATTDLQGLASPCTTAVTNTTSENLSSKYEYDEAGNLVTSIDASGDSQAYTYDALGRMTTRTDGIGGTLTWTYDVRGNRLTQANRVGSPSVAVTWTYDKGDRMLTRVADSATTSYTWNDNGRMLSATNSAGTITATYDRQGRPLTVSPDDGSQDTAWTYTSFTSEQRVDVAGTSTYTLDKFGRETALTAPLSATAYTFAYRADGQRATQGDPSGSSATLTYDRMGRLTAKDVTDSACTSSTCVTLSYTYDRAGQRLTEAQDIDTTTATDGTATYTYDRVGRITNYDSPLGGTSTDQAYGWQKVPNRDSLTIGTGSPVTTTFDAADRITSSGFSHDADGRMTARPGQQLVWDSLGRLTTVKTTGGTTIASYTYDALDRLRQVTRSGTSLRFRYLGMTTQVLQVYDVTTSASVRKYAWDRQGTMLAHFTGLNSGIAHYGTNGHGDMTWTADSTGAITRTARYDPWGGLLASSGSAMVDFRYQGAWYDTDTDLLWVITRWYAPTLGRFVSEDTLLGEPTNPMSRHLYAYATGDPVDGWDPDGRWEETKYSIGLRRTDYHFYGRTSWTYGIGSYGTGVIGLVEATVDIWLRGRLVYAKMSLESKGRGLGIRAYFRIYCNQQRAVFGVLGKSCGSPSKYLPDYRQRQTWGHRIDWNVAPTFILREEGDYFLAFQVAWAPIAMDNPSTGSGLFYGWPEATREFHCGADDDGPKNDCRW